MGPAGGGSQRGDRGDPTGRECPSSGAASPLSEGGPADADPPRADGRCRRHSRAHQAEQRAPRALDRASPAERGGRGRLHAGSPGVDVKRGGDAMRSPVRYDYLSRRLAEPRKHVAWGPWHASLYGEANHENSQRRSHPGNRWWLVNVHEPVGGTFSTNSAGRGESRSGGHRPGGCLAPTVPSCGAQARRPQQEFSAGSPAAGNAAGGQGPLSLFRRKNMTTHRVLLMALVILSVIATLGGPPPRARAQDNAEDRGEYRIGAEDVLDIAVWNNPAVSRTVPVRPDGKISLPLLNDVAAAGLTPRELRDVLVQKLADYMPVPEVSIIVREVHSFKVSVIGEIKTPGNYELKSRTTVLDLLAKAGAFTDYAARSRIFVLRSSGGTTTKIPFNYHKVVSRTAPEENFFLEPGDIVVVP